VARETPAIQCGSHLPRPRLMLQVSLFDSFHLIEILLVSTGQVLQK